LTPSASLAKIEIGLGQPSLPRLAHTDSWIKPFRKLVASSCGDQWLEVSQQVELLTVKT